MTCKGICVRYQARKPIDVGRYASGQKRCQICEIFINWDGKWCPCCGYRLRQKPRNLKYKEKLKNADHKSGDTVKIFKKWSVLKGLEGDAVLVRLLDKNVVFGNSRGQKWLVRFKSEIYANNKFNPECKTEERCINIEQEMKVKA